MPSKCYGPHMPRQRDIQEALGLQNKKRRFARIQKTAAHLLRSAGISLLSARRVDVKSEKRDLANQLEQIFPEVFGVTPGVDRAFALQRDTSYALLTLSMDAAKRALKKKGQTGGRAKARKSSQTPSPFLSKSNARPLGVNRLTAPSLTPEPPATIPWRLDSLFTPTPTPEQVVIATPASESLLPSATPELPGILPRRLESLFTPTPIPERAATATPRTELAPPPTPPVQQPAAPAPEAHNELVLIFQCDYPRHRIYSPMSWTDMIAHGSNKPTLAKVHDNITEDGLDIPRHKYTLINPEGRPVRSDRTFNYVLDRYSELGVSESYWRIRCE